MAKRRSTKSLAPAGPKWEVVHNLLGVRTDDSNFVVPTADDIYHLVFEGGTKPELPPLALGNVSPKLSFSRYPINLELRLLTGTTGTPSDLKWSVFVANEVKAVELPNALSWSADHIVIESCWYPFAHDSLREVLNVLNRAGVTSERLTLRQFLELKSLARSQSLIVDATNNSASASCFRQISAVVPKGIIGDLYPYQLDGWQWLSFIHSEGLGGILADEMGLGKTLQIIALLSANKMSHASTPIVPSLVIATGTLLENWRREIAKFAPRLIVQVHHGGNRTGFPSELKRADVVVTSYDTAVRDVALLRQVDWDLVVLDEAQAIKNPTTRRAKAVKRLPRRVGIGVTGTPIENRLMDLWSIMDFALPRFLGTRDWFERTYSNSVNGATSLEPIVSPILLRRRIKDVAKDLPTRIDIPQALELSPEEADAYEKLRKTILAEYGNAATLVALTKLRMYCAHPALLGKTPSKPCESSNKYQRLVEILEEIIESDQKAIIFTSYNQMSDLMKNDFSSRLNVWTESIDGRVPIEDRQTIVDRFGNQSNSAVLILNPRAAGTGLNIVAANHVIHYNLEWNPAIEDQASARAYRRGQTLPVTVHRLFYAGTVEEVIDDRLDRKRRLAGAAVVGSSGTAAEQKDILRALMTSPMSTT